jgi:zinc protease
MTHVAYTQQDNSAQWRTRGGVFHATTQQPLATPGAVMRDQSFRAGVAALLAACLAASAPRAVLAQQSPLARFIHQTRLDNGLDVIVVENHAVPLATVLVAVRNGAFTQDSAEEGLAHLYEHILFRSYRGRPDAFGIEVTGLNGWYNGSTSHEVVYYFLTVPAKNVERGVKLLAELVEDPRFSSGDLKDERPVVLDELQRGESDPERQLVRHVERMLWGTSWSRKDVGGDSASLAGITLDRLKQTYARYYVPNNAALIVTGDVSSDRLFELARSAFRDWKRGPDPFADRPVPPVAPRTTSTAVVLAHDVHDVTIRIALQGPSVGRDTAATYAADVLFDVFNDPAAVFQHRLVDSGLFQSVSGYYLTLDHTGPIEIVGKTTPERAQDALLTLLDELENLEALSGMGDEDLAIAKKHREVAMALTLEQVSMLAPELAGWWASAGLDYYLGYHAHMAAQTVDDLRRFAHAYVVGRPRVIGVLAQPTATEPLAAWMRQAGRRSTP